MSSPCTSTKRVEVVAMSRFLLLTIACLVMFCAIARADDIFDRLLSPGPLSREHQKLEQNCKNCHKPLDKSAQTKLCRDCHKEISKQIDAQRGYHGKDQRARTAACRTCHTEHKGRNATITSFDRDVFNHDLTEYPLVGGHRKVACASCHKTGAKFAAASVNCVDCHKSDDPHRGRLGPACATCHSEQGWKPTRFNHEKTRFPLRGKHAEATCQSCHPDQRFQKTPTNCFA
jgi:hypothetical protein